MHTEYLRDLEHAETAFALVVEGLSSIFVTEEELSGSVTDSSTWIYTDRAFTDADVTASLMIPESTKTEIDLREARIKNNTTTFILKDIDGQIVKLFASRRDGVTPLLTTIVPGESAVAAVDKQGDSVVGKHIGLERIGSSGERARNPCVFDFQPGMYHPGHQSIIGQSSVPVSSEPVLFVGRRYCLYEIYRDVTDPNTGTPTWRPLSEAVRVHWGVLRDQGIQHKKDWNLSVFGPASWTNKHLNFMAPTDEIPLVASSSLTPEESKVGICFDTEVWDPNGGITPWSHYFFASASFDVEIGGTTLSELRDELATHIDTLKNEDQGAAQIAGGIWTQYVNQEFEIDDDVGMKIRLDNNQDRSRKANMRLALHKKMWGRLGYNINQKYLELDDENFVYFRKLSQVGAGNGFKIAAGQPGGEAYPPVDGYYEGWFTSAPLGYHPFSIITDLFMADPNTQFSEMDNGGAWRKHNPTLIGGTHTIYPGLNNGDGQIVFLNAWTELYHHGQNWRPPASDPNDPTKPYILPGIFEGEVNATGMWLVFGPRIIEGSTDMEEEFQVARMSWNTGSADGRVTENDENNIPMVITKWENPRHYGFDRDLLDSDWVAPVGGGEEGEVVRAIPISVWKYKESKKDLAYKIAERIILGTGTGGSWDSYEADNNAIQTPGQNNVAEPDNTTLDAERFDFGLSIPSSMVAAPTVWRDEADMWGAGLERTNYYTIGKITGEELLQSIFNVRGWIWSLSDGKYGPVNLFHAVDPSQTTVTLTEEDIIGDPENPKFGWPFQDIRALAPIDGADLKFDYNPLEKSMQKEKEYDSTDPGSKYRNGENRVSLEDRGLTLEGTFFADYKHIWDAGSLFWSMRHFVLTIRVHHTKGNRIWPGTKILITDPRVVSQAGVYGITNFSGLVISVDRRYKKRYTEIQVLVYAQNTDWRYYAPSCRGIGFNSANNRIYCKDNWLNLVGRPPGINTDAGMFVEPGWLSGTFGGDADITIYQWDRESWTLRDNAVVSSVNDVVGDSYLQLDGSISYNRDQDTIIVMREGSYQNATWVNSIYAQTTDEDGSVSAGEPVKFLDK